MWMESASWHVFCGIFTNFRSSSLMRSAVLFIKVADFRFSLACEAHNPGITAVIIKKRYAEERNPH